MQKTIITLGLYGLMIGLLILQSCKSHSTNQPHTSPLILVNTAMATLEKGQSYDIYPGSVVPLKEVLISPQISGYITELGFKDGDFVHKGQLLYKIDSTIYIANMQNAMANLAMRQAELDKAGKDLRRYRELSSTQAISPQQLDYAESNYTQALKMVDAASANLKSMASNLEFSKIYAPFSGTIGISRVRIGSSVLAGQSILNTISTNDPMYVDFFVEQGKIAQILNLSNSKNQAFAIYLDDKFHDFASRLEFIDRSLDLKTASIRVRLQVKNSQKNLKAGMNVSVKVLKQLDESVLTIPNQAITPQMGEFYVYILKKDSSVQQEYVHLGHEIGDRVVVTQGLKPGDEVIIDGLQKLRNGMKVLRAQH